MSSRRHPVVILLCLAMAGSAWAQSVWVSSDLYDKMHVVIAPNAAANQKHAAEIFLKYWKLTTGHDASLSSKPENRVNVWIGREAIPEELLVDLEFDTLGPDGFILDTLRQPAGQKGPAALQTDRHLLILGGTRGIVYAVYQFFEDYLGVRWLAPGTVHLPEHAPPALPEIHSRRVPDFEYRYTNYIEANQDPEFQEAHKLSQGQGYGLFGHTVYELVPPETYFAEHPEYYSLIDGERRAPAQLDWRNPQTMRQHTHLRGQLCFSNPEVAEVIAAELRKRIKENPEPKIWSVSQMDWAGYCQCSECASINEKEGTHAGALLTCVNRVARALADDFPEHRIETLAYQWSRKPPRELTPAPNVIIRLCTTECDFARPLTNPKFDVNRMFQDDIQGWTALTRNVYIWDYAANLRNYQTPHPNLHVIQPNLQFFRDRGAVGVFEQGCPSPGGELAPLRQYLLAKCLWDPDADGEALTAEFINLYYGPAAPPLRQYIALVTEAVLEADVPMTVFETPRWMDYEVVTKAQEIFNEGLEAVGEAEPYKQRLQLAYVPVQYAALICPPDLKYARYEVTLRRPPSPTLEEYVETLKAHGVTQTIYQEPFEAVIGQVGGVTPPRRVDSELRILENEFFLIWVAPALEGSIIRWRDKKQGIELLQGFRTYGRGPGTLQDWTFTPSVREHPVAPHYDVNSRTLYALTLETTLADGLEIRREMELRPASAEFTVTLTVTNTSDKPLAPKVKIHPEFALTGDALPELWLEKSSGWEQADDASKRSEAVYGEYIQPFDGYRWAYRLPSEDFSLINEFISYQIGGLLYFYNTHEDHRHVNLEILPKEDELDPGKSRQLKSTYFTTSKRPDQF